MLDIEVREISKVFPAAGRRSAEVRAVDDVSVNVAKGELFFLLGPSGCGKTTLLRMLAGFVTPTAGRIFFDGRDVTDLPPEKRNLAMVFQNYALWPHMTVAANVAFGPRMAGVGRRARKQTVARMLDMVGMADRRHHRPGQLSGGQQQRVALARALAAEPVGLLLDEPLSNLDARLRLRMRAEIRRIVTESGVTGVYVTHDQEEALSMADRIAVMVDGRIAQVGSPREVYHRPTSRFVADFLGEANFLPAVVRGREGESVVLETAVGVLRARADRPVAEGAEVTCCIRPERVRLDAGAEGDNRLEARCLTSTSMGATRRYELAVGAEQPFTAVVLSGDRPLGEGESTRLNFAPADVVVLP